MPTHQGRSKKEKKQGVAKVRKQKPPTPRDLMKLEIAGELGLLEKVQSVGWVGLTAQEAGAIGGVMSHRLRLQSEPTVKEPVTGHDQQQERTGSCRIT